MTYDREPQEVARVTVVGAGLIGAGWVATFLAAGRAVAVHDMAPDAETKVREHVARVWPALAERGLAPGASPDAVSFHDLLEEALDGAHFVQENTPEREPVKRALFGRLGAALPVDVLIASSTSNMPVTLLQESCAYPERCVLGHPFNPVHLLPLVEVGGGEKTDRAAVDAAIAFYAAIGKHPVRLEREILGHIANRLTAAMFREAVSLVANGIATVKDVDDALRYGPALKWAIQGQFTTFHTSGGAHGLNGFLKHFGPGIVGRWATMATPDLADEALQTMLADQVVEAHVGQSIAEITMRQDNLLADLIRLLEQSEQEST
ncbi:MAG: 3-hydroxyacyl-CoA dehydrogenase NAD-binding domain-containing protein [Sphingomicrobium sp.]